MTGPDDAPDDAQEDSPDDGPLAEAYATALRLEKSGDAEAAAAAWREVLRLDPADRGGAAVRLAALGRGEAPPRAPEAYVATLFDQHAEMFEEILVGRLSYEAPALLRARIDALAPGPYRRMLDLGCGTGLAGRAFSDICARMEGVDLSEGMLEIAEAGGIYDELYLGEAAAFLHAPAEEDEDDAPWDLVVAADVLPYLGDLAPLLTGAAKTMAPGGVLALTAESLPADDPRPWAVGPSQRYLHAPAHLASALDAAGFDLFHAEDFTVRTNEGRPEPGRIVLARRRP